MKRRTQLVVPEAPVPEAAALAAERTIGTGGLRLGILNNSKGNADHLLGFLVQGVRDRVPIASLVSTRKSSASLPAPAEVLDRLAKEADYVVTAMAD